VLPRDESQLKAACERLVRQIEATDSVREMHDAASALAHVDDPLVVPYLERVLRSGKYVEHPVIDGLARIGNEDAAQILIAVVKESPAWPPNVETLAGTRAILARQALQTIATSTSNVRLRQEIQRTIPN
jgi:HEAT repeat protein